MGEEGKQKNCLGIESTFLLVGGRMFPFSAAGSSSEIHGMSLTLTVIMGGKL